MQRWQETFDTVIRKAMKTTGASIRQKYADAFSQDYRLSVSPIDAIRDIRHLEQLTETQPSAVELLKPDRSHAHYRLHFYSVKPRFLDEYIPLLENLNLRVMDQVQYTVNVNGNHVFIKSFTVKSAAESHYPFYRLKTTLLTAIQLVLDGRIENDAMNKLLVLTGMAWHEIDVLRAYRNYFLQLGLQISTRTIHHALTGNSKVTQRLFLYFEARFRPDPAWADPAIREEQGLSPLRLQLLEDMAAVADINDDRILRTFFNLIDATLRSNYHRRIHDFDYFIALKINSLGIFEMPAPKPQVEIYVHSVDMEGIHLRAGKISRGGIRWSDRPDDFRTEILGLMQTQISKNALIIPTGAKGGFIVKKAYAHPDFRVAGKKAYLTLIRALLDLTDNYAGDEVVKPDNLIVHDDDDPYLVVAADKGTASFSDIANSVSTKYGFWLGDAFASGGSNGYDHKTLGITARGAFECVKRHFREIGKDILNEPFTVVGIGSMDGDVFGNGMLLSRHIRLLAAISGQHIFIDPNPLDSAKAFQERRRLFTLPGSSWNDYDRSLLSPGGGIYERASKDIKLSSEVKKWLGIRYQSLDGESLIRYLLTAPVELLWLGGIGTYVKATFEKHEQVGDHANDNVRINAADLKANVVGEGANLGFTQKARIEYGLLGGRINTDAIDNSAGVDTSDHEVNLKILLSTLNKKNIIDDYQPLFIAMTDEVCKQVLADNYAQSLCLSMEVLRSRTDPSLYLELAEQLDLAGLLDRTIESFPRAKEVAARSGQPLTRPELAVLMAAGKMYLTRQIENQFELLKDDVYNPYLLAYFPAPLVQNYSAYLAMHPLAAEIKATLISNKIINQAGCLFLSRFVAGDNGADAFTPVNCYLAFEQIVEADRFRRAIYQLDNQVRADAQYSCLLTLEQILMDFCDWTLQQKTVLRPDFETIQCYRAFLKHYEDYFYQHYLPESTDTASSKLSSPFQKQLNYYQMEGLPSKLAREMVFIGNITDFPLLVMLALSQDSDFLQIVVLFNEVKTVLELDTIYQLMLDVRVQNHWERSVTDDTRFALRRLAGVAVRAIMQSGHQKAATFFDLPKNRSSFHRFERIRYEISRDKPHTIFPFIALTKALGRLLA